MTGDGELGSNGDASSTATITEVPVQLADFLSRIQAKLDPSAWKAFPWDDFARACAEPAENSVTAILDMVQAHAAKAQTD